MKKWMMISVLALATVGGLYGTTQDNPVNAADEPKAENILPANLTERAFVELAMESGKEFALRYFENMPIDAGQNADDIAVLYLPGKNEDGGYLFSPTNNGGSKVIDKDGNLIRTENPHTDPDATTIGRAKAAIEAYVD